jgi:hypothetical protein
MKTNYFKNLRIFVSVAMLLAANVAFAVTTTVNLTAQRMSTTLPDGITVPMWGYCTTGSCTPTWAPGPTITVPAGTNLRIVLNNMLPIPTSLVILGQYGGGLGTATRMVSPTHAPQSNTTFPGNGVADPVFTPPTQLDRARSFATEVGAATANTLTWNNLKSGTYIYETGTLPSIEAPMGLYGVLIVTQAPVPADTSTEFIPGNAYPGIPYDTDTALLFSEIDPVQNKAVDDAAADGADFNKRFNDPTCSPNFKCYPAAVNYTPTYFLINGQSFDKSNPGKSIFPVAVTPTSSSGNVLIRLLNAGLHTHIPSVVGLGMSLMAEDGNVAPGNPKIQNEVLLTAGKTYDVLVSPPQVSPAPDTGNTFAPATFAIFDRQLSLTTSNQLDGGMQGVLQVAGGSLPSANTPQAVADTFAVPLNTAINGNVRLNDIAVMRTELVAGPVNGTLTFNNNGTFVYTPATGSHNTTETFTYTGNGGTTNTATVTLNIASGGIGISPIANADIYTSNIATRFKVARPGVLSNDSDPSGYPLTAVLADPGTCTSVMLNADGSFSATPLANAANCTFTYQAKNSQDTSASASVTVNFPAASGITLALLDATTKTAITDYRWTIQEDLTFKVDSTVTPPPSLRTLGTSFHKSYMPVIATGCVGTTSCGAGQSVAVEPQLPTQVGEVGLDPTKHYYISILPGDAGDPVVNGGPGHMMGGVEVKPDDISSKATVTAMVQATPLIPAQLSVYIYEDNSPTNNQDELTETGLGDFSIVLVDPAGRTGDPAGQQTYDAFNMPLTNALLGQAGCPDDRNTQTNGTATSTTGNLVGMIYTCPNAPPGYTGDSANYSLAGHALIKNLTPARYDVIARPGAAREGAGEVWWQVETLEGTPAQDAFTAIKEPAYFQEFGPPGFHTTIGFVNPDHVKKYALDNGLTGTHTITGRITNMHMSRPIDVTMWDAGSYDMLSSSTCQIVLNSQGGTGPAIASTQCDQDGNFTLSGVPAGSYQIAIFDQWLDIIIQFQAVTVKDADTVVAMGNIPVLGWFQQHDQNIFMDANNNGKYDDGESGIANVMMTVRYRDGGISNQTLTDSSGNGLLAEMFPLFNWYVTEADTTRYKQTGVNIIVDAGGKVDTSGPGAGLWSSVYQATPANPVGCDPSGGSLPNLGTPCGAANTTNVVEKPGAYSYGLQGFISQRNQVNWGRAPYAQGENGGIQGVVVYSSTRPFDDQRYNVQTLWEPLVPRVTVNLYRKEKLADGTDTLTLVDTTQTTSWDDWVNAVDANGIQVNMQCPGQRPDDPYLLYTLAAQNPGGPVDQFRCYDGFHMWNQVQAAPYDGRYQFPSGTPAFVGTNGCRPDTSEPASRQVCG